MDGGSAHAAAGTEYEDVFARLELGAGDQHMPRRLEDERDRGGLFERKIFGTGKAVDFGDADKFGAAAVNHIAKIGELAAAIVLAGNARRAFAAGHAGSQNHFLADANSGNFGADFGDFSGHVAARNVREGNGNVGQAAAHPEVEMIQRASAHAHEHFRRAGLRVRHVGELQNFGPAVLVEEDGFHVWLQFSFELRV